MQPPESFAEYPSGPMYGSSDKLQALSDGYFGLNIAFMVNVVIALGSNLLLTFSAPSEARIVMLMVVLFVVAVIVFLVTLPFNKKIGYGMQWQPAGPILASALMGLNSALCCGIIGYVVLQSIALSEIKKYGVRTGFFMRKAHINEVIAQMQMAGR